MEVSVRERLRACLRRPDQYEGDYHSGDALFQLFRDDSGVTKVFRYDEEDYQGTVMVVWKFEDRYVHGFESYGSCSGCDPWIDATPEEKEVYIDRMFGALSITDKLWEVEFSEYRDRNMLQPWREFLAPLGMLGDFEAYNEACCIKRENERLEEMKASEAKKRAFEEDKQKRETEKAARARAESLRDVEDLIAFFRAGAEGDPFFKEKLVAKKRMLVGAVKQVEGILTEPQLKELAQILPCGII